MKKILVYGVVGGILIALLEFSKYRFIIIEHRLEIYGGIIAAVFTGLGIWFGLKLTKKKEVVVVREITTGAPFVLNQKKLDELEITAREMEILQCIAQGLSNKEIGEKLFVSENTVKTHSSRLFEKLNARRRTQAVQIGKGLGLIP